jgi:hypothetical protein
VQNSATPTPPIPQLLGKKRTYTTGITSYTYYSYYYSYINRLKFFIGQMVWMIVWLQCQCTVAGKEGNHTASINSYPHSLSHYSSDIIRSNSALGIWCGWQCCYNFTEKASDGQEDCDQVSASHQSTMRNPPFPTYFIANYVLK